MPEEVNSGSLQRLLENALDPMLVAVGATTVFANGPALALTGYDRDEVLSLTVENLIHPDDRDMIEDLHRASQADVPAPGPYHTVLVCKDKSIRPVEITVLKTTWQGQRAAFLVLRDTSRRAEEIAHLREIEQNLRFLIENSNDGIVVVSEKGLYAYVNRPVAEWSGYSVDEIIGRPISMLFPPAEAAMVAERFAKRIAGRAVPRRYETRVRTRDGRTVPVEFTGAATTWRGDLAVVVIVRDLTEQKAGEARLREEQDLTGRLKAEVEERRRVEQALRASEKRFRDVAEASGEYIWELDAAGKLTFVSDKVTAILGYTPEELVGRTPFEFSCPPDPAQSVSHLFSFFEGGQELLTLEQCARARAGHLVWLQVHVLPLRDESGLLLGFRGTALDISEQKKAEEALRRRDAILEAVSFAAERLIRSERWDQCIGIVLERLGRAAGADRAGLYQVHMNQDGALCTSRRHAWNGPQAGTIETNEAFQNIPLREFFPESWIARLSEGQPVMFTEAESPEGVQHLLKKLGACAVLAQPVLVDGQLWGMLNLSTVAAETRWQPLEIEALQVAGNVLGGVLQRAAAEEALKGKDAILEAVSFASERLLGLHRWEDSIEEILQRLGLASGASRVVLQDIKSENGEHYLRWRYGWASAEWPFTPPQRPPEGIPLLSSGYETVLEALRQGKIQILPPKGASPQIRDVVLRFGVTSVLSIPITVQARLWGVLGISQCGVPRSWSAPETDALKTAADILGVIMERQQVEEALRQSEEKYRSLVEGAEQIIAIVDRSGVFHFANRRARAELGREISEIVGKTMWDLFPKEHADRQMMEINRTLDHGATGVFRSLTQVHQGLRWYETRLQPLRGQDGRAERIQLIATDVTDFQEAEERLLSYQEKLRSLSSELALTEQRERRRIAAELHDRIGQTLAVTKIKLSQLRDSTSAPPGKKALDELWGLVDQTIQDTRSLTFELSPPMLYELGLEQALAWLAESFRERHGISTSFRDDGQPKRLGADLQGLLFQATQELLVNVVKHAAAKKAVVTTRRRGDEISIEVEDDGRGFDPSAVLSGLAGTVFPTGFGLFSIRERLGHLGGRLEITSGIGLGTKVVLQAPLLKESEKESEAGS